MRRTRGTICTNPNFIGHRLVAAEIVIGAAIVAAEEETAQENRRTGVCPGIKNDFALHCHERTISLCAKLKSDDGLRRGVAGREVLGAGVGEANRAARGVSGGGGQRLYQPKFPTESATYGYGLYTYLSFRHLERLGYT